MGQDRLNGRCRGDVNLNQPAHLMDIALLWLGLSAAAAVAAATVRLLLLYAWGLFPARIVARTGLTLVRCSVLYSASMSDAMQTHTDPQLHPSFFVWDLHDVCRCRGPR